MAEETTGQDQTQTDQTEEQTSQSESQETQDEPYKVFKTKEEYSKQQDNFFRGAYNEGLNKAIKDAKDVFGVDIDDYDKPADFFKEVKTKIASTDSKKEDEGNPEIEELKSKLQEWKQKAEQKEQEFNTFKTQQKINQDLEGAIDAVKQSAKELTVRDEHLKRLFSSDYNVKLDDAGNTFVERQDGTPVLDGEGNRKDVSAVLSDFVKEYGYAKPVAEGAGGGTSGGSIPSKPKFSEFTKLLNSPKQEERQKAMDLRAKAQEHGWDENDSPKTAQTFRRAQ